MCTALVPLALVLTLAAPARADEPDPEHLVRKALQATGFHSTQEPVALHYRYGMAIGAKEDALEKMAMEVHGESAGLLSRLAVASKDKPNLPKAILVTGEKK